MARTVAELPAGTRITDYISVGVLARAFSADKVRSALEATQRDSVRQRDLPAHVVVYYVIRLVLVYGVILSGGAPLPAGRDSMAAGSGNGN